VSGLVVVFLFPAGLAALVVVPALFLLDRFSDRRRDVALPSLHLARRLATAAPAADRRASRRALRPSLLLKLAGAALAATLLGRPAIETAAAEPRRLVAVVDASASTGAAHGPSGRTRFDAIRGEAIAFLDALDADDRVLLLAAPGGAPLGGETGPREARARVPAAPAAVRDDWRATLAAARLAAARPGADGGPPRSDAIVVFTDRVPPGVAGERVVARGAPAANAGIVALTFPDGPDGDPFAAVAATVAGRARLVADGAERGEIEVAPGAIAGATFRGAARAEEVRVELPGDALPADDAVAIPSGASRPIAVALTGDPAPPALRRALAFAPGAVLVDGADGGPPPDLEIALRAAPRLGARETVLLDAPPGTVAGGLRVAAGAASVRALRDGPARGSLPSLERAVGGLAAARRVDAEAGVVAQALLVAALEPGGEAAIAARAGDVLAFGFDPATTEWPNSPSWPAFWAALVAERFSSPSGAALVRTGEPFAAPASRRDEEATLVRPDGSRVALAPDRGAFRFTPDAAGVYRLETSDGPIVVSAALLSASESACPGEERSSGVEEARRGMGEERAPHRREAPIRAALALLAALALVLAIVAARRER